MAANLRNDCTMQARMQYTTVQTGGKVHVTEEGQMRQRIGHVSPENKNSLLWAKKLRECLRLGGGNASMHH
jgi:hypothetical protein